MTTIDFTPIKNGSVKMLEFSQQFTTQQLRDATNESIDVLLKIIHDAQEADIAFLPHDPNAHDPYAKSEAEQHIGWSLGHLVAHVTASSEEGAAFYSLLARGVELPEGIRLRYETAWETVTTKAQCIQRLEESRRIRLSYLDAAPDQPQLEVYRPMSERFLERFGKLNAPASFLFGLMHEHDHYEQFGEVARQAREKRDGEITQEAKPVQRDESAQV
jgi:hypothetical protein